MRQLIVAFIIALPLILCGENTYSCPFENTASAALTAPCSTSRASSLASDIGSSELIFTVNQRRELPAPGAGRLKAYRTPQQKARKHSPRARIQCFSPCRSLPPPDSSDDPA